MGTFVCLTYKHHNSFIPAFRTHQIFMSQFVYQVESVPSHLTASQGTTVHQPAVALQKTSVSGAIIQTRRVLRILRSLTLRIIERSRRNYSNIIVRRRKKRMRKELLVFL